jgi:hypothetical protein
MAHAQQAGAVLTLNAVVEDAAKNYPAIQISQEELNASGAKIHLARTAYLPRVDALAQFNRGTRNNVFGSLLPQGIVPSMSGPVIGTNNGGSVWGSVTGGIFSLPDCGNCSDYLKAKAGRKVRLLGVFPTVVHAFSPVQADCCDIDGDLARLWMPYRHFLNL